MQLTRRSLLGMAFQVSFAAGGHDTAGQFMGGTEMRVLAAHRGMLFAGNGYWMDRPGLDESPGAQILVLSKPDGGWTVDHTFADMLRNGRRRHLAISALKEIAFGAAPPILLASTWDLTGTRSVFARDPVSGRWSGTALAHSPATADFLPHIRCFGQHRDAATGAALVFAGDPSGVFAGVFDPNARTVHWAPQPELPVAGLSIPETPGMGDRLRMGAFAEANGKLHVSIGQQIYQRVDGAVPSWRLLYTNPLRYKSETGLRGLTPVRTPSGRDTLLAAVEGNRSRIVRVNPADGNETTDLDLDAFLDRAWSTKVSYVIAAYNDMALVGDSLLLGIEAFIPPNAPRPPEHTILDVIHGIEAGGWFLVRDPTGRYEIRQIDAAFPAMGRSLVSVRAILASPFPSDADSVYFAGYDANYTRAHNTAWIARTKFRPA